jgi:cyanoexosortase B-associated protein
MQTTSRPPLYKHLVVLFILAIALFSALPNYLSNRWVWKQVPEVSHIPELRQLREKGMTVDGWRNLEQREIEIGGHKWSAQAMVPKDLQAAPSPQNTVMLLMRPQTWGRQSPQVDWMDINGTRRWTADSVREISFTTTAPSATTSGQAMRVNARFLRGWDDRRTYAVLQWYARPDGGSHSPNSWFFADQRSQLLNRKRSTWVAVSILMPMKPLGDIETVQPEIEKLGNLVQSALVSAVFEPKKA